jgi:hypothetical protein
LHAFILVFGNGLGMCDLENTAIYLNAGGERKERICQRVRAI